MAILSVIEYQEQGPGEIVHRIPESGSGEFRLGSQLIVQESQTAVFFRDGKALDIFGPGRHTLSTMNIPLLANLISIPFGGQSPFRAEVYFVNMHDFIDQKWGTSEPIAFRDSDLGIVRLRSFGTYSMAVNDPQLFVNQIVGSQGIYETSQISNFLRSIIIQRLTTVLGSMLRSVFDLPSQYDNLAASVRASVQEDFRSHGLLLKSFQVQAITPPEEVQKAIDSRSAMGALSMGNINPNNMAAYTAYQTAGGIRDAANNPGTVGGLTGAGVGMGMGMMMAQQMMQQMMQMQQHMTQLQNQVQQQGGQITPQQQQEFQQLQQQMQQMQQQMQQMQQQNQGTQQQQGGQPNQPNTGQQQGGTGGQNP